MEAQNARGIVIKEKMRAMTGQLPHVMRPEIARAAVYLSNRTPKYTLGWKTPYEVFFKTKPLNHHLRLYGCKAFALNSDTLRKTRRLKRLEPRAWIGYLMGYASTNLFRVWIPFAEKVIITRDVHFNEDVVFDGKVKTMRHDVRNMSLEYLAEVIRSEVRKNISRSVPSAYHDIAEDPEWNEAGDETDSRPQEDVIPSCSDVYTTAVFEPMLTPPDTPPASLHVAGSTSVEPSQTRQSTRAAPAPWQCAFLAGQFGNAVANVEGRMIDRAEFRRQLLGKQRSETQNATTLTREQVN